MKGLEFPLKKILIVAICLIVTVVFISLLLGGVWPNFEDFISSEKKVKEECSRWASENFSREDFTENKYPTLYELYGGNAEEAKNFCLGKI
jgi:hypothetical protein